MTDDNDNIDEQAGAMNAAFQQRVVEQLNEDAAAYDGETMARLNAAREKALAVKTDPLRSRWLQSQWGLPLGSVLASAAVFALFIGDMRLGKYMETLPISADAILAASETRQAEEVLALISDEQDIEFYQRLEFIEWLADADLDDHVG